MTIADNTPTNTTLQPAPTTASTLDDIVVTIKDSLGNIVATKTFPSGTTSIDLYSVSTTGIPVGGTATVTYTQVSTNNYDTNTQNPLVPTDTTTLKLTASGTAAPAPITNTDTFNVKDMNLVKIQALDANCDGTADGAFTGSETSRAFKTLCQDKLEAHNRIQTTREMDRQLHHGLSPIINRHRPFL